MSKPINISVPDDLYKRVKKNKQIQISSVCQTALLEAVEGEKTKTTELTDAKTERLGRQVDQITERIDQLEGRTKSDMEPTADVPLVNEELAKKGAVRLTEEFKSPAPDYYKESYQVGQEWAAKQASLSSLKQLKEIFGRGYLLSLKRGNPIEISYVMELVFDKSAIVRSIPKKLYDKAYEYFCNGAWDMWLHMKKILEAEGYEIEKPGPAILQSKGKGFPRTVHGEANARSKLKELIKEEAKKQLKDQFSDQLLQKEFLKSEGLKKLLESHTIYRDTERKIKAEVKDSTIKRWLREANEELLAKKNLDRE